MRKLAPPAIFAVLFNIVLLLICVLHIPSIDARARVPFDIVERGNSVFVESIADSLAAGGLRENDEIISWDSSPIIL